MTTTALLWFRRDLRLADHPALTRALGEFDRVAPVFVLDDALLRGRFASAPRTAFMLGCLRELAGALRERGSGLVIRHGRPEEELVALARDVAASAVLWTSDVAPYARARDGRVTEALRAAGAAPLPQGGAYVVDVSKPRTKAGRPFTVFTPFHRHWLDLQRRTVHRAPAELPALPSSLPTGRLPALTALGLDDAELAEPACEPGESAARAALARWLDGAVDRYGDGHDALGQAGTSRLSPYLRWGCISAAECEARAARHGGAGAEAWIRQLCWREFYAHVLLTHPGDARREHQERYRDLQWHDDRDALDAWREGR
ncbi:MAG: deoxyribodipyrimidine photo-lyase, partial [Solirubrobacteraceae bacterium]|nr:deoxyribodipyrimidine photo-lyase [Solirubrobacteraceae bacterium]